MRVPFNYLPEQFADVEPIFAEWRRLIATTEFTLGPFVEAFERRFAAYVGARHCVSTNTGTDALILALRALGVGPGHEVVTVANTFYATVGAIVATGARPVFVDSDDRFQMDADALEAALGPRTRCVIPVHWGGASPDIERIVEIASRRGVRVVEDACPAVGARVGGRHVGTHGTMGTFSMHPLKPLNVMGDGGMVVTDDDALAAWMRRYRNHGMVDRDHIEMWGVNMRLQPLQAVVASHVLDTVDQLVEARNRVARLLDTGLAALGDRARVPARPAGNREAYALYLACFRERDALLRHLVARGVEAKVHYPVPLHLQVAAAGLGHGRGDFPRSERQADELITLPAHQYVTPAQVEYMLATIRGFYDRGRAPGS